MFASILYFLVTAPGCGHTETSNSGGSFIATTLSAIPQQSSDQFSSAKDASHFFLQQVVDHNVDNAMLVMPIVQMYESVDFDDSVQDLNVWDPLQSQTPASPHANLMIALRQVHEFERLCANLRLMNHRDSYRIDTAIYFRKDEDRDGAIKDFKSALSGSVPNEFESAIEENSIVVDKKTTEGLDRKLTARMVALDVTQAQALLLVSPKDQAELLRLIAIAIDGKWYIYNWQILKQS